MHKVLKGITPPEDDTILMRYMNFEKFANILATNSLFFTRADKFDDQFERVYTSIYNGYFQKRS